MKATGGFFWVGAATSTADRVLAKLLSTPPAAMEITDEDIVTNCVFMYRPRWWQLHQWYRAVRLWLR